MPYPDIGEDFSLVIKATSQALIQSILLNLTGVDEYTYMGAWYRYAAKKKPRDPSERRLLTKNPQISSVFVFALE